MIDFNDTNQTAEHSRESDRDELRVELLERLESVLTTMFPAGKKRKGKFLIGDVLGSPGDSLEVVLDGEKAGLWTDRATGDGGDIFALIAACIGADVHSDFSRVLDEAADLLGRSRSVPMRKGNTDLFAFPLPSISPNVRLARFSIIHSSRRRFLPFFGHFPGIFPRFRVLRTQLCRQAPASVA